MLIKKNLFMLSKLLCWNDCHQQLIPGGGVKESACLFMLNKA